MSAAAYHIISNEEENHIFRNKWIFRHTCMCKQLTLKKLWNYNIFVQILYSYFRYIHRFLLECVLFVSRCNIIRASLETKKERQSYRKSTCKNLCEGNHFIYNTSSFLYHFFVVLFVFSFPFPKWLIF